ncbi:MAG: hypothetical protein HY394_01670 [Candidatus Diapherotrites archaeon]|nr:hypothetical protein [Candidatus Diapherotrites archaeon]
MDKMKFKNLALLALLALILLAGCTQFPQTAKSADAGGKQAAIEDSDLPPAPPSDNEEIQAIAEDESDAPPAIPSEEDEIPGIEAGKASQSNPQEFAGSWRALSSRLFYDAGGGGDVGSGTGHRLEINADGTWQFSSSAGKWSVAAIEDADWTKWKVDSYGPARKIVLDNWNGGIADGPIEESDGQVDFIWLIYRAEPPTVSAPGQVQAKYGHAD